MVAVPGGFCIDSTEVTNAQYLRFVTAAVPFTGQPAECSWNTSWTPGPGFGWPYGAGSETLPMTAVDWCDARAYCAWAGKRLCGHVGSGSTPFALFGDPAQSEWHYACTANGTKIYPYGDTYAATACEGADIKPNKVVPVASKTACIGGYPGIYDMSGNVYEWEDSCDGTTGATDQCHLRGGGDLSPSTNLQCGNSNTDLRQRYFINVGIRCCAF
jgi:formylglycine-generating enzyme required for sulfatase activity